MTKLFKLLTAIVFTASAIFVVTCSSTANTENIQLTDKSALVDESNESAESAESLNRTIRITVSKNGYEPKSISVKKGKPVKLAFLRTDEENCGDELVFPKLNIKKKLPIGETVMVEFTPQESGELGFTCGMDMLRGKVLVQ